MNDIPNPLPLSDFISELRNRGLSMGVSEHLSVGKLLDRWEDIDITSLRCSLMALLARNPTEAKLVQETFDEFYVLTEPLVRPPTEKMAIGQRIKFNFKARWYFWVLVIAAFLAGGYYLHKVLNPDPIPTPPPPPPAPPSTGKMLDPSPDINKMKDLFLWKQAGAVTGFLGLLVVIPAYFNRLRMEARARAYRQWSSELDAVPGPYSYPINTAGLVPPYSKDELDDISSVLSRSVKTIRGDELDVEKSLNRTLNAGLYPQIVFRTRATPEIPLLVLVDEGDEMRLWRSQIDALLSGLEERGVHLDRWHFHISAERVYAPDGTTISLKQLTRLRSESSLIIISCGEGVLEGENFKLASWIATLNHWRSRAWLHPVSDIRKRRAALDNVQMEVWPMTGKGILAAARQIARGDSHLIDVHSIKTGGERSANALDIQLLCSLLTFCPSKDPDLLEMLRQHFYPNIPKAATVEALAAPPLSTPLPIGPKPEKVHAYLLKLLNDSRPKEESLAHLHWRLDVALQQLGLPEQRDDAIKELTELADEPIRGYVGRAVTRSIQATTHLGAAAFSLPTSASKALQKTVLRKIIRRTNNDEAPAFLSGRIKYSTRPTLFEVLLPILAAAILFLSVRFLSSVPFISDSFTEKIPVNQNGYTLQLVQTDLRGPLSLVAGRLEGSPASAELISSRKDEESRKIDLQESGITTIPIDAGGRGRWYYLMGYANDGTVRISNVVPVPLYESAQDGSTEPASLLVKFVDGGTNRSLDPYPYRLTGGENVGNMVDGRSGEVLQVEAGNWILTAGPVQLPNARVGSVLPQERVERQLLLQAGRLESLTITIGRKTGTLVVLFISERDKSSLRGTYAVQSGSNLVRGSAGTELQLEVGDWVLNTTIEGQSVQRKIRIESGKTTQEVITITPSLPAAMVVTVSPSSLRMSPGDGRVLFYNFRNTGGIALTVTARIDSFLASDASTILLEEGRKELPNFQLQPNEINGIKSDITLPYEVVSAAQQLTNRKISQIAFAMQQQPPPPQSKSLSVILVQTFLATDETGKALSYTIKIPIEVLTAAQAY